MKKYIDDVFTEGHGTLYASDGRTRKDPSKKYGSGGLVQGKKYMLSLTGTHQWKLSPKRSVLPRGWR